MTVPPPDIAPALTPDLVYKRDVLRRRLGTELGDRTFREWLERSLAAVTPEPEEPPVAEPAAAPRDMRAAHGPAENSASVEAGAGAIAAELEPEAADCGPEPCAERNGHDTHSEEPESDVPEPQLAPVKGCLWPEGEPPELTFCGAERSPGRSYCPEHCARAYVPPGGGRFPIKRFHSPPQENCAA